jgi:molybdenum cofactor biosynthesis enzyme MoaA
MTCNSYKLETNIQKWVSTGFCLLNIITDSLKPRMFVVIIGHIIIKTILRGIDKTQALGVKVTCAICNRLRMSATGNHTYDYLRTKA